MRITGGELAGRRLRVPRGEVRPTADRVREALFSMLAHRGALEAARVLDLFAGSGALGIEALSRGGRSALFVEKSRGVAKTLGENLASLDLLARARVVQGDAAVALRFDLCFVDPPYASALAAPALATLAASGVLSSRALLVAESDRRHAPGPIAGLELAFERAFGDTLICCYRVPSDTTHPDGETRA